MTHYFLVFFVTCLITEDAFNQGMVSEMLVRARVKPLFYTRMRLGEFDPPQMNPYLQYNLSLVQSPEHQKLAVKAAMQSFVLLKNEDNLLPVKKHFKKIAVSDKCMHNPFPNKPWFSCVCSTSLFENTAGKGEIACNEQFLLFPQCFLPIWKTFFYFHQIQNYRLQTFSFWRVENLPFGKGLILSKREILDSSKLKECADDNFNFNENGNKVYKCVENTVRKGEIACFKEFLLFSQCFQKTYTADT